MNTLMGCMLPLGGALVTMEHARAPKFQTSTGVL